MMSSVDWIETQKEVHSAIRSGFGAQRFVSSKRVSQYILENPGTYTIATLSDKAACERITRALRKDPLKSGWVQWNVRCGDARKITHNPVWIVPWVVE